jgi:hypothetical protein
MSTAGSPLSQAAPPSSRCVGEAARALFCATESNMLRALGATLVVSRCRANSTSQRNMEKAGLVTAYTKVVWEQVLD